MKERKNNILIIISSVYVLVDKGMNYFRNKEQNLEKSCIFTKETMDRAEFGNQKVFAGEKKRD